MAEAAAIRNPGGSQQKNKKSKDKKHKKERKD